MLKNYFLIAVRNLVKNRAYSLINILGLAAGIAVTILIALFVFDELSYDQFHEKKDRIYRVSREWFNEDGTPSLHLAKVAPPIGTLVLEDYPDIIEAAVRIRKQWGALLRYEDKVFTEDRFYWAEPSFFDIFSYPMLKGDKETALNEPNSVLLTETAAAKYFGNTDPIGKTILLSTGYDSRSAQLVVTGIVKDPPENTHFHFDFLGSFKTIELLFGEEFMRKNWGRNNYSTYVLFKEENGAEILESKFPGFLDKHLAAAYKEYFGEAPEMLPSKFNKLHLMNITDIHLHSNLNSEMEPNSSITNVYLFSTIAFFVLLIACINFMNLSTARSSKRAREIGMRKVLGAYKTQLIRQFLGESFIVTFIALLLAVVAVELILPEFNGFINRNLRLLGGNQGIIFGGLLLLLIFVSLIAGSYPAFALSSFKPVKVLKGDKKANAGGVTFRTVLVVTQFVISISLIIAMGIVWQQMDYLQNKRLGINKENIVLLNADSTMIAKRKEIKTELYRNPKLNGVTFSSLVPSNALLNSWGGKKIDGDDGESLEFRLAVVEVDYDYLDTYGIELLAGRNFSPEYAADDSSSYILNETAVRKLGWTPEKAVGKPLEYGGVRGTVIGVAKNIHFESLHNEIVPMIYLMSEDLYQVSIRIAGNDIPETIDYLRGKWEQFMPGKPFDYTFLDEQFNELYKSEEQLGDIFGLFAMFAIFIACLGLFGLAAYTAERKTKEIGIRKVLGASVPNIIKLISKEFLLLIAIASLIGWVVSYLAMSSWLEDFAYRTEMSIWIFILSSGAALFIALLTVGFQAVKAALINPVKTLKYE